MHGKEFLYPKSSIKSLSIDNKLVISVADSKYGTDTCRELVSGHDNWVHLFRINSTRNIFPAATPSENASGNIKRYGKAMRLNKTETHTEADEVIKKPITKRSGKSYQLVIKVWRDQLLRGTNTFKGYEHPITVMQLIATDSDGKSLYKNPLWLGLVGNRRNEITPLEAYHYYDCRFDIEHYFRFGKDKLLFNKYQTPDVQHEEAWWRLAALAYTQLYLSRSLVPILPKKWERYLPSFQINDEQAVVTATPSQTQRGFYTVLDAIGTPARTSKPRGNPKGRRRGETQDKRLEHKVIFKNSKSKLDKNKTIKESENKVKKLDPEKIEDLLGMVKSSLEKMNFTPKKFCELLEKQA